MKKTIKFIALFSFIIFTFCNSDNEIDKIKFKVINKKVKDFPDEFDLSSPLKSYATWYYTLLNGKNSLVKTISTNNSKYYFNSNDTIDESISNGLKQWYLNTILREIAIYKDSVAYTISQSGDSSFYGRFFVLEYNKWVQQGEDAFKSISEAREHFRKFANYSLMNLRREYELSSKPQEINVFTTFLKHNTQEPVSFVLEKLKKYKLTMYGEIHFRKVSWNFCRKLIKEKEFSNSVGTIFLEFASHKQYDINLFLSKDTLDYKLLLGVFQEYIIGGWVDKGRYDFIIDIWHINKNLPEDKRIKIVLVDTPRPFSTFKTIDDINNNDSKYNRDEYMASKVLESLKKNNDNRNAFFIVGTAHVCKSLASSGKIITDSLSVKDVYTIFTHSPRMDNFIDIPERLRFGYFDKAFLKLGNKSMAFDLHNSPFGKEPFDALYYEGEGTYENNYDGYIFFESLDDEPNGEILFEIFDVDYIKETERIYNLLGWDLQNDWGLKKLDVENIKMHFVKNHTKKRWENILTPLKKDTNIQ